MSKILTPIKLTFHENKLVQILVSYLHYFHFCESPRRAPGFLSLLWIVDHEFAMDLRDRQESDVKKSVYILISLIFSVLLVSEPASARGPGEAGGGGNGVYIQGRFQTLDLAVDTLLYQTKYQQQPGDFLPRTRALRDLHLDKLDKRNWRAAIIALEKVNAWPLGSSSFGRALIDAVKNAPTYYTDLNFGFRDPHFYIPESLVYLIQVESLKTMAFYALKWGILFDKKSVDALDEANQVVLLLHESVRHVQIFYGYKISPKALQMVSMAIYRGDAFLPADVMRELTDFDVERSKAIDSFKLTAEKICVSSKKVAVLLKMNDRSSVQEICELPSELGDLSLERGIELKNNFLKNLNRVIVPLMDAIGKREVSEKYNEALTELTFLRSEMVLSVFEWELKSQELQLALRTIQDATVQLNHWALDSILEKYNRGGARREALQILEHMENFKRAGVFR